MPRVARRGRGWPSRRGTPIERQSRRGGRRGAGAGRRGAAQSVERGEVIGRIRQLRYAIGGGQRPRGVISTRSQRWRGQSGGGMIWPPNVRRDERWPARGSAPRCVARGRVDAPAGHLGRRVPLGLASGQRPRHSVALRSSRTGAPVARAARCPTMSNGRSDCGRSLRALVVGTARKLVQPVERFPDRGHVLDELIRPLLPGGLTTPAVGGVRVSSARTLSATRRRYRRRAAGRASPSRFRHLHLDLVDRTLRAPRAGGERSEPHAPAGNAPSPTRRRGTLRAPRAGGEPAGQRRDGLLGQLDGAMIPSSWFPWT
jgi:hypothetical protein